MLWSGNDWNREQLLVDIGWF